MIAQLTGRIALLGEGQVVIDVAGVGYLVFASGRTLAALPGIDETARLLIETHVREDHIHLYGFFDEAERLWFRILGTVQGVGAKVALAILSTLSPDQLLQAIAAQDKAVLGRAPGVGPKLAGRIASELKDKVGGLSLGSGALQTPAPHAANAGTAAGETVSGETVSGEVVSGEAVSGETLGEATSALVNLGYGRSDAFTAVGRAAAELGEAATVQALIRRALSSLAPAER